MQVKKFFGATTRDALKQVRDELGQDALILSNRPIAGGGVEIMAVADADVNAIATPATPQRPAQHAAAAQAYAPLSSPAARLASPPPPRPAASHAALSSAVARTYAMPVEPLDDAEPMLQSPRVSARPAPPKANEPAGIPLPPLRPPHPPPRLAPPSPTPSRWRGMFDYRTGRFVKLRLRQEGFECLNQPSSCAPAPPPPQDGPIDVYDLLHASQTPSDRLRPRPPRPPAAAPIGLCPLRSPCRARIRHTPRRGSAA